MKATHSGHCQVCGGLQKLPNGRLSLHGYRVEHGFFSGTCHGARALPFEQAHDLVDDSIIRAGAALQALEARQARLRALATEARCVVHAYVKDARTGRARYEWQQVDIRSEVSAGGFTYFFYGDARSSTGGNTLSGDRHAETNPLAVATKYNSKFADWLEAEARSLRSYIAWQAERVRTWVEQPLVSVATRDDKAAFKPCEPVYAGVDTLAGSIG